MRTTGKIAAGVVAVGFAAALAAAGGAAAADDPPCRFTDLATQALRDCEEGPSEASFEYVSWLKSSGYELVGDARAKFDDVFVHTIDTRESTVSEDLAYDETDDDRDDRERTWERILALLKLFVLIIEGADAYIDALGLSGPYDGVLCAPDGTCVDAFLDLQHQGGQVDGRLLVKQAGMEIDAGLCGGIEIPVVSLPVHATSSSSTQASGATTREVDFFLFFTGSATAAFDLALRPDRETLDVTVDLILEDPCPDRQFSGLFHRRMDALLDL